MGVSAAIMATLRYFGGTSVKLNLVCVYGSETAKVWIE